MVNPMLRNTLLVLIITAVTLFTANWLLNTPPASVETGMEMEAPVADYPRGPHNGRLLKQNDLAVEITIFETGVPPEFRVFAYRQDQPLPAGDISLNIELKRTGNVVDQISFSPEGEFLRGNAVVKEPHSFDVSVNAVYNGKTYQWQYQSYEGRTVIPATLANEAGIKTEIAGPASIIETRPLTGRIQVDPSRVSQIRARFEGVVKRVHVELGDSVKAGATLLTIQSNESLREYTVTAPISGQVIDRNVQVGEVTSDMPLLTLVDLSEVWVELDVFSDDTGIIKTGQMVELETLDGQSANGTIAWLSPLSSHASQSIHARVPMHNPDGNLRPGQFVRARIGIAIHEVPLAVKRSGIQGFRDFQVVFARFDDTYEVRMLELGIGNDEWVEVTGGLLPGTEYVTENSYLIKADIEKSGASHDH